MEKNNQIQLKEWLELHPYNNKCETDDFYLELANTLFDTWNKSKLTNNINVNVIRRISMYLAAYLEDIKSDFGLWKAFVTRHTALYDKRLPIYESQSEDNSRPQLGDINFIIWYSLQELAGKPSRTVFPPFLSSITMLSGMLHDQIRKVSDKAPVNSRMKKLFSNPNVSKDFSLLKQLLNWFFTHSYLIEPSTQEKIMMNHRIISDKFKSATDEQKNMFMYGIMQDTIFTYPCGPLSLYVKDWLHAMAIDNAEAAELYRNIEAKPTYNWLLVDVEEDNLVFDCLQREYTIKVVKSAFKNPENFEKGKTVVACGFVKYAGTWIVNGIISITDVNDPHIKNIKKMPDRSKLAQIHSSVYKHFLSVNDDRPLAFFDTYDGMNAFFTEKMKWPANDAMAKQLASNKNFTLFAEEDKGIIIAVNIAEYIKSDNNPLYNQAEAQNKALLLFINKGLCPIDLLEYLEDNEMIPDANFLTDGKAHNVEKGKALLQSNWDFIARMFLQEFYWDETR